MSKSQKPMQAPNEFAARSLLYLKRNQEWLEKAEKAMPDTQLLLALMVASDLVQAQVEATLAVAAAIQHAGRESE